MKHASTILRAAIAAALAASSWANAAELHSYRALALTSAGDRLAAIESGDSSGGKRPHAALAIRDAATGKILTQYDPCASCSYDQPSWSADGQALAFIATDGKAGTATLYVARGADVKPLATVKGVASTATFSPDGKQIALLATVGAKKLTGATQAGAPLVGEIGSEEDEQRIAVVPAAGGELRLVSPNDTFVYEYDWAPDGKGFAVTSAKGNGDNNWWVATLGYVDAASGALRVIAAPKMQMNLPRVSPDGKTVAFVGGLMSDFGSIGGDVFAVPVTGGEPVNLTPNYAGTFNGISWRGNSILTSALVGSDFAVVALDPARKTSRTLWSGPVTASGSRDGRFVFNGDGTLAASVHEDFTHAQHIVAGRMPKLAAITHDNDSAEPQVTARSVTWKNEGFNVQGWLISALNVDASVKHPMVVQVHGGPAAAVTPRYVSGGERDNNTTRALLRKGYFIFMPNPRGSYGQGLAFTQANKRDFGGGDWRDINAGIDAVLASAPVDGNRLGLMGHSYGGFMTMWGVTHSVRFKAAVAGAGIANWISYYGQNGIDQWMIPFFGASAYDDPAIYRKLSPIETIKTAKTPTLIYVGERDVECPPAQSIEFWHGLKAMGVDTKLVIYEGEGHGIRNPEHSKDLVQRSVAWFDDHLK
ncbi:S9 family peptidase [Massilia arenosa]|uniref:S9 family peptidase n=2 Tax=Zemynaea arenosa TaxID=2561931 RepID=A0A4Y9SIZ8_9BURK|nr:S9 family peptidase [Massilia arenosa]